LHSTNKDYGEKKKAKKEHSSGKKKSIEYIVENEESEYPGLDPNKTMINVTNELSNDYKKTLKEEIMDEITENLMEKLQDTVNKKVQDVLKKYQDTTNKKI
jgi:hypothetical protein